MISSVIITVQHWTIEPRFKTASKHQFGRILKDKKRGHFIKNVHLRPSGLLIHKNISFKKCSIITLMH